MLRLAARQTNTCESYIFQETGAPLSHLCAQPNWSEPVQPGDALQRRLRGGHEGPQLDLCHLPRCRPHTRGRPKCLQVPTMFFSWKRFSQMRGWPSAHVSCGGQVWIQVALRNNLWGSHSFNPGAVQVLFPDISISKFWKPPKRIPKGFLVSGIWFSCYPGGWTGFQTCFGAGEGRTTTWQQESSLTVRARQDLRFSCLGSDLRVQEWELRGTGRRSRGTGWSSTSPRSQTRCDGLCSKAVRRGFLSTK